jgi:hypothetical protein
VRSKSAKSIYGPNRKRLDFLELRVAQLAERGIVEEHSSKKKSPQVAGSIPAPKTELVS